MACRCKGREVRAHCNPLNACAGTRTGLSPRLNGPSYLRLAIITHDVGSHPCASFASERAKLRVGPNFGWVETDCIAEKERIVATALEPGAVASEVARAARIYTSQLFRWRQQLCEWYCASLSDTNRAARSATSLDLNVSTLSGSELAGLIADDPLPRCRI
jgi:hypothetical protein